MLYMPSDSSRAATMPATQRRSGLSRRRQNVATDGRFELSHRPNLSYSAMRSRLRMPSSRRQGNREGQHSALRRKKGRQGRLLSGCPLGCGAGLAVLAKRRDIRPPFGKNAGKQKWPLAVCRKWPSSGGGGNRTRVPRHFHTTFYVCSRFT